MPTRYGIRPGLRLRLREPLNGPVDDDAEVREALTLLRASPGMARAKDVLAQYAAQHAYELALPPDVLTAPRGAGLIH